jgi:YqjK-like protein
MNKNMARLVERREYLIAQAAAQRRMLAQDIEPWRTPLALTDQGLNALRYIRSNPKWLAGGLAVLVILKPRHMGKWLGRVWVAWQVIHSLRGRSEGSVVAKN